MTVSAIKGESLRHLARSSVPGWLFVHGMTVPEIGDGSATTVCPVSSHSFARACTACTFGDSPAQQ